MALAGCQGMSKGLGPSVLGTAGAVLGNELGEGKPAAVALGALGGVAAGSALGQWQEAGERKAFASGYDQGRSDEVKRLYWSAKRLHENHSGTPIVERAYYEVPVAEHVASDGTIIEAHTQVVEVVE